MEKDKKINIVCSICAAGTILSLGAVNVYAENEPNHAANAVQSPEINIILDNSLESEQRILKSEEKDIDSNNILSSTEETSGNRGEENNINSISGKNEKYIENAAENNSGNTENSGDNDTTDNNGIAENGEDKNNTDIEDEDIEVKSDEGDEDTENKPGEEENNTDNENNDDLPAHEYDISWYNEELSSFEIENKEQLWGLTMLVNGILPDGNMPLSFEGKQIEIKNNISLDNEEWIPIGQEITPFKGHLWGQGKTISRFKVTASENEYGGLFGYLAGKIENINISYAEVKGGIASGIAAGCLADSGSISDVTVSGNVLDGGNNGGVAGIVHGEIINSVNNADISSTEYAGGIAAVLESDGKITGCANFKTSLGSEITTVYSKGSSGGIAGRCMGVVDNCENNGFVEALEYAGGICGYAQETEIKKSASKMTVRTSEGYAGGILGEGKNVNIRYCYNVIKPESDGGLAGGIAAILTDSSIEKCFTYFLTENNECYPITRDAENNDTAMCYYLADDIVTDTKPEEEKTPELGDNEEFTPQNDDNEENVPPEKPGDGPEENQFIPLSKKAFASGEAAWMLNTSNGAEVNEKIWGNNDLYPVLSDEKYKPVFKVSTVYNEIGGSLVTTMPYAARGTQILLKVSNEFKYKLADLWIRGEESKTETNLSEYPYNFFMPDEDVTVHAVFESASSGNHDNKHEDQKPDNDDEDNEPIRYTVTFDAAGGVFYRGTDKECGEIEKTVISGRKVSPPDEPMIDGYDFDGWYLDAEGASEYDFSENVQDNFTVYAVYSRAEELSVTFDLNGGKGEIPSAQTLVTGEYIKDPGNVEWNDDSKLFNGWTTEKDNVNTVWDFSKNKMPKNDIILYALWIENDANFIGKGIVSSPYVLESEKDLQLLCDKVNSGETYEGRYFSLGKSGIVCESSIGNKTRPFMGVFDGKGHSVQLNINSENDYQGLFGFVKNGSIKNVTTTGRVTGNSYVGSVAGYIDGGSIEDCVSETEVIAGGTYVGGIAGYGAVKKSKNSGMVSGKQYVGGIVGKAIDAGGCDNSGDITSEEGYAGGIAGDAVKSTVVSCSNSGNVLTIQNENSKDEKAYTGGIAGILESAEDCVNCGEIVGCARTGGIAGRVTQKIEQCSNSGNVMGTVRTGGIVGSAAINSVIRYCVSEGDVVSYNSYAGGVCGDCESNSVVEYSACTSMVETSGSYCGGISARGGNIRNSFYYNAGNKDCALAYDCEIYASYCLSGDNSYDDDFIAPEKSAETFAEGMVSWLLNTDGGGKFASGGNSLIWTEKGGIPVYANGDGILIITAENSADNKILIDGKERIFQKQGKEILLSYKTGDKKQLDEIHINDYWSNGEISAINIKIDNDDEQEKMRFAIVSDLRILGTYSDKPEKEENKEEDKQEENPPKEPDKTDDKSKPAHSGRHLSRKNLNSENETQANSGFAYKNVEETRGNAGSVSGGGTGRITGQTGNSGNNISVNYNGSDDLINTGVESNYIYEGNEGNNVVSSNGLINENIETMPNINAETGIVQIKPEVEFVAQVSNDVSILANIPEDTLEVNKNKNISHITAEETNYKEPSLPMDRRVGFIAIIAVICGFLYELISEKQIRKKRRRR